MAPKNLKEKLIDKSKRGRAVFRELLNGGKKREESPEAPAKAQTTVPDSGSNVESSKDSEENDISEPSAAPSQPVALPSWQLSEGTGKWKEAVEKFNANHPDQYNAFLKALVGSSVTDVAHLQERLQQENLPECLKNHQSSTSSWARVKQSLQTFVTITRPIAMTVSAAADPTRGASIACAATFFAIEIALRQIQSEDYQKIMSVLSEAVFAIVEWITFERDFMEKSLATVEEDYKKLEEMLPNVYQLALLILSDIYEKCNYTHILLQIITKWEKWAKDLKLQRDDLTLRKKNIESRIVQHEKVRKILDWVQGPENPEPSLDFIRESTSPDHRYDDAAEWFLSSAEYIDWQRGLLGLDSEQSSKRVLWLCGPYGTGKTTIYMQTLLKLRNEVIPTQSRIIPYICSARAGESKRPTYETILRTIARKLSILPGFSLDPVVRDAYMKQVPLDQGNQGVAPTGFWEGLLRGLFERNLQSRKVVILIDALDECASTQDTEKFTRFMRDALDKNSHVHAIFTSRQHVSVGKYLSSMLYKVDITGADTIKDMKVFIERDVEYRMKEQRKWDKDYMSIFFKEGSESLLQSLKSELLRGAKGMFIWVRIWLDLMLPLDDFAKTIRFEDAAKCRIEDMKKSTSKYADEQLKDAYQRMWDANEIDDLRETRIRLFQLVLHSFEPLEIEALTHALRVNIQGEYSYNKQLHANHVKQLCANFLRTNLFNRLEFIHDSGRHFIETMKAKDSKIELFTDRACHLYMAKLYFSVIDFPAYPSGQWALRRYCARYGMRHCYRCAEARPELHDFWKAAITEPTFLTKSPMACQIGLYADSKSNTLHLIVAISGSASMIREHVKSCGFALLPGTDQVANSSETYIYAFPIDDYLFENESQHLESFLQFIQITINLWSAQSQSHSIQWRDMAVGETLDRVAEGLLIMCSSRTRGIDKLLDRLERVRFGNWLARSVLRREDRLVRMIFRTELILKYIQSEERYLSSSHDRKIIGLWSLHVELRRVTQKRDFFTWLFWQAQSSAYERELLNYLLQIGEPEHMDKRMVELSSLLPDQSEPSSATLEN